MRMMVAWGVALALLALSCSAAREEARTHNTASDDLQTEGLVQHGRHLLGPTEDKKLWSSASKGYVKAVEKALEEGADIDVQMFKFERTPILVAIIEGHSEVVTLLINAGADLEIADKDGETPLLAAIFENDLELVKELLAAGASPNGDPSLDKKPKAGAAAANDTVGAVEEPAAGHKRKRKPASSAKGPASNLTETEASTPGDEDEDAGAKGAEGHKKHRKKSRGLLQAGTDPQTFTVGDNTAARFPGLPATPAPAPTTPTRPAPADPAAPGVPAVDPVDPAVGSADPALTNGTAASDANVVEPTAQGGSRNRKGRVGRSQDDEGVKLTPLILAAAGGNPEIVEVLLEAGALPDLVDDLGDTPLHKASLMLGKGSEAIARMLIDAGTNVDARGFQGRTPLFSASEFGNLGVLKVLLEASANPTITDVEQQKAVDVICECASLAMFNLCPDGRCEKKALKRSIAKLLHNPPAAKEEKGASAAKKGANAAKKGADE